MKKNVLFIIDSLEFGGIESTFISWVKYLSSFKNVNVSVMVLRKEGYYAQLIPKNVLVLEPPLCIQKQLLPFRRTLRECLKSYNIIPIFYIIKNFLSCFLDKKYFAMSIGDKMRKHITTRITPLTTQYDIAVAYSDNAPLFFMDEKVTAHKKIVWIHADYSIIRKKMKSYVHFYCKIDKIICVSKKVKDAFIDLFPNLLNKTAIINNILDYNRIDEMKNNSIDDFDNNIFKILNVGRLSPEKNQIGIIKAFYSIIDNIPSNVNLYIIGDGKEREKLLQYINKMELSSRVFLLGAKSNPYPYINKCDIYVHFSYYEGFCTTINEAKYLERPIITTNVAGVHEMLENGKTGIIIENNITVLGEHLKSLICSDKTRKDLISNLKDNKFDLANKELFKKEMGVE